MSLQKPADGVEKRRFGRRNTLWHAWIAVDGRPREACIVRNFSVAGAMLEFPDRVPETRSFRLIIDAFGFETLCSVRHRRGQLVGVFFPEQVTACAVETRMTGNDVAFEMREALKANA
jgi:hypothetical protein